MEQLSSRAHTYPRRSGDCWDTDGSSWGTLEGNLLPHKGTWALQRRRGGYRGGHLVLFRVKRDELLPGAGEG